MKILVCLAYYGTENEAYVRQVIAEYRSMAHDIDIVVVSEAPKEVEGVDVVVGLPSSDPYSLPFAHKTIFADRRDDYDLFIYSEDDTLVRSENIDAFVWATRVLPDDMVAGCLRTEVTPDGERRCSSVHSQYHWEPDSAFEADGELFAHFTNPHGACYFLTRKQLATCIESGRFLTEPHSGRFDMRVTAATDPYTVCGLRKVVCLSRLDDFLLPHLTNKYTDLLGAPYEDLVASADALRGTVDGSVSTSELLAGTTTLTDPRWDRLYHEPASATILDAIPTNAQSVLSVGCGSGLLEAELIDRGLDVTAIPLDAVIGAVAARRGVHITAPAFDVAIEQLEGRQFDVVVLSNVLQFLADPLLMLRTLRRRASDSATLIATVPNLRRERLRDRLGRDTVEIPTSLAADGVAPLGSTDVVRLLHAAGFVDTDVAHCGDAAPGPAALGALLEPIFEPVIRVTAAARPPLNRRPQHGRGVVPVSLGLPVFNGEDYLADSLAALRAQTFADIEILISDNASDDGTEEICRSAAHADDRIRYVRHERNRGAAFNYNAAFSMSRGEYFCWTAHDDIRHPLNIERSLEAFRDGPSATVVVAASAQFIDSDGAVLSSDGDKNAALGSRPAERVARVLDDVNQANQVWGVIRADVLERTNLIGSFIASDYVLLAELAIHGEIRLLDEQLFSRRVHPQMSRLANESDLDVARWFDVTAKKPKLSARQRLAVEYLRMVDRSGLTGADAAAARATIPTRMVARSARNRAGRMKADLRRRAPSSR